MVSIAMSRHGIFVQLESDKWSTLYPGCNPKLNEFTSPINISSSDAVNAKNVQTLFVYSGEPERDTYLVSSYYLTNGYYMEACKYTNYTLHKILALCPSNI
ncbi:unnamed protein product [Orchesella dallaii]|uniref:Uncharacterized protein n=1 Tax=Orchesella dallaii TaxID=48710 RepID=A0ABP1S025_9HEXA